MSLYPENEYIIRGNNMAKKIIKKAVKETIKKFKPNPNSTKNFGKGAPEKGTVGAQKKAKAKAKPTGVTKAKPKAKVAPKAKPTKGKSNPSPILAKTKAPYGLPTGRATKKPGLNKREKAGLALAGATAAGFVGTGLSKRKKPAAKVTFGEAFKEARKKGEGTKFTWEGKQYTAVTKDDLKKKGYDANELKQYANRKGKARGPLNRLGQKAKKVLLGKDKKFGGDKGAIDFIRRPKKKAAPQKKMGGGMANSKPKKFKAGGMATKGLGKAYMKSKR